MSRSAIDRVRSLGIDPTSFPLEDEQLEQYMVFIGQPYKQEIPSTYEELVKIVDDTIHSTTMESHRAYIRSLPQELRLVMNAWQSFQAVHIHHNIRLYMEDPSTWKEKVQSLGLQIEDESRIRKYIEVMEFIINGAPPLTEDIIVFRKVTRNPELSYVNKKMDYINKSFTSTTIWFAKALEYAGHRGKVIKIILPAGTKCLYLGGIEQEILLPPGAHFIFQGIDSDMALYTLIQA